MSRVIRGVLGDDLLDMCASAKESVLLVAPFIKRATLERLVEQVPAGVPVCCVTRWVPEEIIAGVSDLEIWPLLLARGNTSLALQRNLHAKYYRADDACLVGSANLTYAGLGWKANANLELLLPLSASLPALKDFESDLASAIRVTDELYREFERAVEEIRLLSPPLILTDDLYVGEEDNIGPAPDPGEWLPALRHPAHLFNVYNGNAENLTNASRMDAAADLRVFRLPMSLSRESFIAHVRLQLLQMPVVRGIDVLVGESQRFGAIRDHLSNQPCAASPDFDASVAWQTLMRWLLFFAGDRYVSWQANYSEIFQRRAS